MSVWRGRRVLVTGASGFIGASLVRALLEREACVHAWAAPQGSTWRLDEVLQRIAVDRVSLSDRAGVLAAVERVAPDAVFHLAARGVLSSEEASQEILATNVLGTYWLLEACVPLPRTRVVLLGGASEYAKQDRPLRETDPLEPATFYGASKAAATLIGQQHARRHGLPIAILRPFTVYGPWESPRRLVPAAIAGLREGREIPLTPPGIRRDFVFVEDVVEACLAAAERSLPPGVILNVGTGIEHSNEDVVNLIGSLLGLEARFRLGAVPPHAADRPHWVADLTTTRRLLGWEARHSLEQGLRRTLDWWTVRDPRPTQQQAIR
ncbi:MAG TPA: NAD-dependent epimerase/dehydratase family protein [Vicinamibacteria bacterium]|nr:NAD-dependent epimerase/dehydratase family protein [Vicinamibacteria bacterium]